MVSCLYHKCFIRTRSLPWGTSLVSWLYHVHTSIIATNSQYAILCHDIILNRIRLRTQHWGTPLRLMAIYIATTYGMYHVKVGVHHFPGTALEARDSLTLADRKRSLKQGIAIRLARGRSAEQKLSLKQNCLHFRHE